MIFTPTDLPGVWVIDLERLEDERGFFARSFCQYEFARHGLNPKVNQCNISFNEQRGTLRGLHRQTAPWEESKLVRCERGAIFDVALDLRRGSRTFLKHFSTVLDEENRRMVYIAEGIHHGFLTLRDNTQVFYQMSESYHPEAAIGVRWDDPAFGIPWPEQVRAISARDSSYPDTNLKDLK